MNIVDSLARFTKGTHVIPIFEENDVIPFNHTHFQMLHIWLENDKHVVVTDLNFSPDTATRIRNGEVWQFFIFIQRAISKAIYPCHIRYLLPCDMIPIFQEIRSRFQIKYVENVPDILESLNMQNVVLRPSEDAKLRRLFNRALLRRGGEVPSLLRDILQESFDIPSRPLSEEERTPEARQESIRERKKKKLDWESVLKTPEKTDREEDQCIGCYDNAKSILTMPCAHMMYCDDCFRKHWQTDTLKRSCPVCKDGIEEIIRPIK